MYSYSPIMKKCDMNWYDMWVIWQSYDYVSAVISGPSWQLDKWPVCFRRQPSCQASRTWAAKHQRVSLPFLTLSYRYPENIIGFSALRYFQLQQIPKYSEWVSIVDVDVTVYNIITNNCNANSSQNSCLKWISASCWKTTSWPVRRILPFNRIW